MTSEEYVNQINRLIDLQNIYLGIFLTILALVIGFLGFLQWKLSDKQIEKMKSDITNEYQKELNTLKIQSSMNINGSWTRFPDGTQVCMNTITLHSKDFRKDIVWTLPARFFDKNIVVVTELDDRNIVNVKKIIKEESQIIILLNQLGNEYKIKEFKLNLIAIGRWKREDKQNH